MIIYQNTKNGFIEDICNGILVDRIDAAMEQRFGRNTPKSEKNAWTNSLSYMGNILSTSSIPDNAGVAIEYNIPYTAKRVDLIVSGFDRNGRNSAVIIELKQWESAKTVPEKDAMVRTFINGGERETTHPSYQAWSYAMAISDFNADVQDRDVLLQPCACLHNYAMSDPEPLLDSIYSTYVEEAPVFSKYDGNKLKKFLESIICKGDDLETVFLIDQGKLRPSKSIQDALASMMKGNREFIMIDTQKVVYEEILDSVRKVLKGGKKKTIIVKGGPGTGKTVLAINLLSKIVSNGSAAPYVTKNSAPRNIYNCKLKGSMKKNRIDSLFMSSGKFITAPENSFDVLLTDEAHRLNEKSGMFSSLGENQMKEIINASRLSVFFIDEDQRVTIKDAGTIEEICRFAKELGSEVVEMELDSQFRCSGSDGYLEWLDHTLQIRETAMLDLPESFDYDFRVFDDPCLLRKEIEEKNAINNKSRIVAGYCWDWLKDGKNNSDVHDITIPEFGFEMSWNLGSTSTWAIDPESVKEAGCIHTCQGLEFDYVGVIIGPDMRYESGNIVTDASRRAKTDQSLKGLKSKYDKKDQAIVAARIIKNTYKVLMTRGMKGCYVYCTDKALSEYFRKRLSVSDIGKGL